MLVYWFLGTDSIRGVLDEFEGGKWMKTLWLSSEQLDLTDGEFGSLKRLRAECESVLLGLGGNVGPHGRIKAKHFL